jgi:hypothetical protein
MTKAAFTAAFILALAAPVAAKESLGVYSNWGAFRDDSPLRCYAIAKPSNSGDAQPFASISNWPRQNVRGQVHFRLSRSVRSGEEATLTIGDRRFALPANDRNAWAQDARMDAAIVAALRSAPRMSISARASNGSRFTDRYDLTGAATAIDAAVVGCASR